MPATGPRRRVLVLTGPTGTGKSRIALELATQLPLEIVSVDSAQVYRGMDIGTAKPTAAERAAVPHHLIDIRDPAEPYSAGDFVREALAAIEAIHARGRVPLLVGGTMLYLRALLKGLAALPGASPARRQAIDERARRLGWAALHAELARVDPEAAARIHPNDPQRIQRALEVYEETGRPISMWQRDTVGAEQRYEWWRAALIPGSRAEHAARLGQRFEQMLADGLYEEVAALYARGDLDVGHPSIRSVGYRQLWACFQSGVALADAKAAAIRATVLLAKRQLTWVRADPGLLIFNLEAAADATKLCKALAEAASAA